MSEQFRYLDPFEPAQRTLERLRGEFLEMPGLRLTIDQVARLCGVEQARCKAIVDALVDANFLCVKADGRYARVTDGAVPRPRPAKVGAMTMRAVEPRRARAR